MFKAFGIVKRKRKGNTSVVFGVFQRMGIYIERQQRRAANCLNAKTARLSRRQLLLGFWIFCIGYGGSAIYVTAQAFYQPAEAVLVKAIHIPKHSITPGANEPADQLLTEQEVNSILQFQYYLDSLEQTAAGKQIHDSIAHKRPGLLDSLRRVQQLFSEQLKTREDGETK